MARRSTVHILIGAIPIPGGTAYGVVFRDGAGRTLHQLARRTAHTDPRGAVLAAMLRALWVARRFGRTVRVAADQPEVVDWLNRRAEPDDGFLATFVQIRALAHSYRRVEIAQATEEEHRAVRAVAERRASPAQVGAQEADSLLPLWSGAG